MLTLFDILTILLVLTAFFGWFNHYFLHLPHTIGLLVMALFASLLVFIFDFMIPSLPILKTVKIAVSHFNFQSAVLEGMLAFLLFAGALHINFSDLRSQKWAIGLMVTVGVVISIVIVGTGFWMLSHWCGVPIPFILALIFGALISPTDPVAVMSLLKTVDVPHSLKAKIAGEALFNDGVGVVAFVALTEIYLDRIDGAVQNLNVATLFLKEMGGGVVLGLVMGWGAVKAMASIKDLSVEILITLAVASLTYALALKLHFSGPISVVIAGLLVANLGGYSNLDDRGQEQLFGFWEIIDEVLNSVLFLLIGLEVLVLAFDPSQLTLAILAIPIVLLARLISVSFPILLLSLRQTFAVGAIPVLTWGGLRGGISIALALSLDDSIEQKPIIMMATYAVVLFSVIIQGLTVKRVVDKLVDPKAH